MEDLKIVLGNKIMSILFFVDRSPSMNAVNKEKKSSMYYLNQCLSTILESIVKQTNLRSCVEIGYLMENGGEYNKIEFGDVSFEGVSDTDRSVYRLQEAEHRYNEKNKCFRITYYYPKFQAQRNNSYGGTNLFDAIDESLKTISERLDANRKKPVHPSFLIVISDGDHSFENENGKETIRRLREHCLGDGPVSRMIVPLFVDVSINGESKYLKSLAEAVYPAGYIRYSPKIDQHIFSASFQRMLLSAQKSANKQGSRAYLLAIFAQKLKE